MTMTKRVIAALMAALVVMMTTYNAYTVDVHATGVVEGALLGELLVELAAVLGVAYVGDHLNDATGNLLDRNSDAFQERLFSFCCTNEGYNALLDVEIRSYSGGKPVSVAQNFGLDHLVGGSNQSPDPKKVKIVFAAVVTGLIGAGVIDFISKFYANETASSSGSAIGAAINAASSQNVTYAPFPKNFHFSSINQPVYSLNSIGMFNSYPEFSIAGNSFLQMTTPYKSDQFFLVPLYDDNYIYFRIYIGTVYYNGFNVGDEAVNGYRFDRNFINDQINYFSTSSSRYITYAPYRDGQIYTDLYMCGNVHFDWENASYVLNPDGSIYEVVDGQPDQLVIPHITTAEGYLTSVKPIVNMDISALVKAIGKAIADAHPDEAPVLTPEAINQIYNNVSNVYDNAVTNYYNDTSYIDQSQYITNITNVYEQAIADNPALDTPVVPAVGLGNINNYKATGLSEVFPFCIPFDMYDLMSVLVVEPKAISFDCNLYFGEYIGEYVYTVDLSVFDPVAKVFRITELILYMFGLMLVTRSLIRG